VTDFRLLETMRVEQPGDVYLLDRHLARLRASAQYFSFQCDIEKLRNAISGLTGQTRSGRLRVLLSRSGEFELDVGPLPAGNPLEVKLSTLRVHSDNIFLYHKTTHREIYDQAGPGEILVNERDEITETAIANIAVLRGDRWITPALRCGLLPGVLRAESLERGEIQEGILPADELIPGETIRCFNALRGIFDARFNAGK
jgi:para-aminobenzoate synthetase/4-amino-4-deoxychorismate lyase